METKKIELIFSNHRPLTDIIKLAVNTIPASEGIYQIVLPDLTINNRRVEALAYYDHLEEKLKTVMLKVEGDKPCSRPSGLEIIDLIKNFGGKQFYIEYEYLNNEGNRQIARTHDNIKLTNKEKLNAYISTKVRLYKVDPTLAISLCAESDTRKFMLKSTNDKPKNQSLWTFTIIENRPSGPFAEMRMRRINKYFEKYIEPYVHSEKWEVCWLKK